MMGKLTPDSMRAPTATFAAVMCVQTTASGGRLRTCSVKAGNMMRDHTVPPPHKSRPVNV